MRENVCKAPGMGLDVWQLLGFFLTMNKSLIS